MEYEDAVGGSLGLVGVLNDGAHDHAGGEEDGEYRANPKSGNSD